jgi:hypothetical protein
MVISDWACIRSLWSVHPIMFLNILMVCSLQVETFSIRCLFFSFGFFRGP